VTITVPFVESPHTLNVRRRRTTMALRRFSGLILVLLAALGATACEQYVARERVDGLKKDIDAVAAQIKAAEAEEAQYSGGLIKALIGARLATLRHTHGMLEQRIKSWTFGIGLRYTVDGKRFVSNPADKEQASALERELAELRARMAAQELEASRYAGGLIQAMTLASVATMRQTEALLDQRRLLLKYDLPAYVVAIPPTAAATPAPVAAATPASEAAKEWEIISIDTRVTESNSTWSRFAWKLEMKNTANYPLRFDATIEFQDKDGFIIDTDTAAGLVISPHAKETFTGYALIRAEGARRVARTFAKVRRTG
jgi:hypothetical protein